MNESNEWTNEQINEIKRMNERMNERKDDRMNGQTNELVIEWMDVNGHDQWMDGWKTNKTRMKTENKRKEERN